VGPLAAIRRSILVRRIADFPGGSFAFVMATGIVSIAAAQQGLARLSVVLLLLNAVAFATLWLLTLLRLVHHPLAFLGDLQHYQRGPSLLTVVAGTGVLGTQVSLLTPYQNIAVALWLAGFGLWVGLTYCLFAAATIRAAKPRPRAGLDGTWLLAVVAPQSLAILGTHVAGKFAVSEMAVAASLCLFLLGGFFYLIIITLILDRWLFEPMQPDQLTPSYWINMGAAAITTLAGARLASAAGAYPALADLRGFIIGETVLFWTVATWWIPLLLAVMIWRHLVGGVAFVYRLDYWSMVFPIGMYTVASWAFSREVGADFLVFIPRIFVWIAITAWGIAFIGMMRYLAALLRRPVDGALMQADDPG
jgi:tellurite resistance protein TehA-like permease